MAAVRSCAERGSIRAGTPSRCRACCRSSANSKIVTKCRLRVLSLRRGLRLARETGPHLLGVLRWKSISISLMATSRSSTGSITPDPHSRCPPATGSRSGSARSCQDSPVMATSSSHCVLFELLEPRARRLPVGIVGRQPLNGLLVFLPPPSASRACAYHLLRPAQGPGARAARSLARTS